MKKLFSLILIIAFFAAMALTCPGRDAHYDAISEAYTDMNVLTKIAGKSLIKQGIQRIVSVDNYILVSVGTYTMNDNAAEGIVSVGIFGHVFTFTKDNFMDEIQRVG